MSQQNLFDWRLFLIMGAPDDDVGILYALLPVLRFARPQPLYPSQATR